jgi:hypothetical protein
MDAIEHRPTASARASGRVPDFFIAGHPKCGTTALYEMLRRHPQIYMPDWKEPRYFATDLPYPITPLRSRNRPATFEQYLALFDGARPDELVGEGSTAYIWSRTAPDRIAEAQPAARIVAIFREPASFVRSLHLHMLQNRSEDQASLRKAIAVDDARRAGRPPKRVNPQWPKGVMYAERVRYADQLRRYHALFPREQVLVLIYDDFQSDNHATVRTVQRFLGVDDTAPFEPIRANPTVRRRAQLDETVRAVTFAQGPLARSVRTAVKLVTPRRLRREALGVVRRRMVFGDPRPPDERLMLELRRRFKPEVEALSEYIDRDLVALWGYHDLG